MPTQNEICKQLGTYLSVCCGVELVVAEGARFPRCPRHPLEPGEWKLLIEPVVFKKPQQPQAKKD